MVEAMDFTGLIKATINSINSKKTITPNVKQQALRFYFYCQDNLGSANDESKSLYKDYDRFLREKGILPR